MTFLNPAVLIGLAATAIPIIIHFLTRQKAKEIPFSSLRFLKLLENQQIRRLKWKQILLLIIRTLIILFIVLAFARPTLKGKSFWGIGSKANTAAVIILDNSMSMSVEQEGILLYDRAKQIVYQLEDNFSSGDEIYGLFSTPGTPAIFDGPRYNFSTVKRIVQQTTVTQKSTNFVEAIIKARDILLKAFPVNKEIYLISDLQKSGWSDTLNLNLPLIRELRDKKINLMVIPVTKKSISNLSIVNISLANQIIEVGKVMEVRAIIKNTGTEPAKNRLAQIFLDGKRVGQATISLDPGEMKKVSFRVVPEKVGLASGAVMLEDDELFGDNSSYFVFETPAKVKVLMIAPDKKDTRFFQLALNPANGKNSIIETAYLEPEKVTFSRVKNFDVLLLINLPKAERNLVNAVKSHLLAGKGVVLFPGSDMDLRQFNADFSRDFDLPEFTETVGRLGQKDFFIRLGKFDRNHPIFSGVFEDEKAKFSSPEFNFFIKLRQKPQHNVIMNFSDGSPFLVESDFKGAKILLFASTAEPAWSNLYLKGIFVPLLHRAVMYVANGSNVSDKSYFVGDEINFSIANIKDFSELEIEQPNGIRQKIIPIIDQGALKINFSEAGTSGIYKLYQKDRLLANWAVNFRPEESELSPMPEEMITKVAGNAVFLNVDDVSELTNEIRAVRYGRELWKIFALAAFILLLIEMWLARESRKAEMKGAKAVFERNF